MDISQNSNDDESIHRLGIGDSEDIKNINRKHFTTEIQDKHLDEAAARLK